MRFVPLAQKADASLFEGAALIYPVAGGFNVYDNSPEDQALIAVLMAEIAASMPPQVIEPEPQP